MKSRILQVVVLLGISMVLTAAASAQTAQRYRTEIDFDFSIGAHEFAAGEYVIERTNAQSGLGGVMITSVESGKSMMFNPTIAGVDDLESPNRLVFRRYGDRYFLQSIETATLTARFRSNRVEIILAKNGPASTVTVELAERKTR